MKREDKLSVFLDAKALGLKNAKVLTPAWSDADFAAFDAMCRGLKMDPYDLLAVITSESHTLLPSARNPADKSEWPIAVGLNQLTRVAAAAAGLIPKEKTPGDKSNLDDWGAFAKKMVAMPVASQIPIIEAYYLASPWTKAGKPWTSAAKIYAYNAAAGTAMRDIDDGSIIATPGSGDYQGIAALGTDARGNVTGRTIRAAVEFHWGRPLYQAALLRMAAPSILAGMKKGFADAQAHFPASDVDTSSASTNADFYAIGYGEGYGMGQRAPQGATFSAPTYLV